MAARTIPFPNPPGNAATRRDTQTSPPLPPTGVAKLVSASRRYRGLHLVSNDGLLKVSRHLNRLAQTKAIVAQVEREIAQRAASPRQDEMTVLSPVKSGPSKPLGAARSLVLSLLLPGAVEASQLASALAAFAHRTL